MNNSIRGNHNWSNDKEFNITYYSIIDPQSQLDFCYECIMQTKNPKTLKSCVLMVKDIKRAATYLPEYVMFTIPDKFVVGYGLDYKEYYRELPAIYVLTPSF